MKRTRRPVLGRFVGIGGILAAAALTAWLVAARHEKPSTTGPESNEPLSSTPATLVHANFPPAPVPSAVPPWKATRENSPPVPDGQIPAWKVQLPAPDPAMHMPAAPVAPPDPQTTTPPKDNPGGVNGDCPPRSGT